MTGTVHEHGQRFDWQEFISLVSEIGSEDYDSSEAANNARIILDFVETQVPPSDFHIERHTECRTSRFHSAINNCVGPVGLGTSGFDHSSIGGTSRDHNQTTRRILRSPKWSFERTDTAYYYPV